MMGKPKIRQNRWDNWYGYLGKKRAIAFGNTPTGSAEEKARQWLKEQELQRTGVHIKLPVKDQQ